MPTQTECLRLTAIAKASAADPETAYVLRTRLKRVIMAAAELACAHVGVQEPVMPEDIHQIRIAEPKWADIVRLCSALLLKTRTLCQPSEALDSRWKAG